MKSNKKLIAILFSLSILLNIIKNLKNLKQKINKGSKIV